MRVTEHGGSVGVESLDGRLLYYHRQVAGSSRDRLIARSLDGGGEREIDDVFNWEDNIWAGFAVVTALLFLLAILAALIAFRLFKKGSPPTPDLAIQEAKRTRAELEAQKIQRDQVHRTLERGEEVKS